MKTPRLRIALAQVNQHLGDLPGNSARILETAARARDDLGAHVVVFPELTLTGYPPEDLLLRPGFRRQTACAFDALVRDLDGIVAVLGHAEEREGRLHNAAVAIADGRRLATYYKQHLPNYGVFDEKRYFEPGHEAVVIEVAGVRLGLTVCEDLWQAGVAAQARDAGAELILNLNASPFHIGKHLEREHILARAAAESGLGVVYVNQVGGQDELVFDGGSMVIDPEGRRVFRAPEFEPDLSLVAFEPGQPAWPVGADSVAPLEETAAVYRSLVLGVRDYVHKNGFPGAVLGLSGGVDSALTLAIAVDALGADQVEAVLMPSRYTSRMSVEDAIAEAQSLGVKHYMVPIEQPFEAFESALSEVFAGLPADTTEENIQARCRGVILMAMSNKSGRILLTTGNKSEVAVGYATLYGDMAGGFAPLKDVPKTLVYRLAAWRNGHGQVIPTRVLERPPSAELRADQCDQDSLPPYEVLDPILERYIEDHQTPAEIAAAGFDRHTVYRVVRMVDHNEYKRRQAAPGVRISRRAFGRDRRYPITSAYDEREPGA